MERMVSQHRVVITGGAGGIGRAMAKRFLGAGASVVLADRDGLALTRAVDELGANVATVLCDVSLVQDCARLVASAEAMTGGPIDVFIANAGVPFGGALAESSPEEIRRVIEVNVLGAILSAQAAIPGLQRAGNGCLLFTGSLQSVAGRSARSVYTASKHAIAGLVRSLALELGPGGTRVNAIAPTAVDTPFLHEAYARAGIGIDEGLSNAARSLPLGRVPTPDDVAATAFFLASADARAITGQIVMVDCGASAGKY